MKYVVAVLVSAVLSTSILTVRLDSRVDRLENRLESSYPAAVHDAELGTRIELLEREVSMEGGTLWLVQRQVDELSCVHSIFEDGSAMHLDGEIAHECLRSRLGWP